MKGPLLALLVDVYLEQDCVEEAEQTAQRLHRIAETQHGAYLSAAAALAQGRVCIASGRGDARACLNSALEGFARAQLPMELARTRLEMAYALAARSPEVAVAQAKAALQDFERLEAARYADAAGALLRSLGAPIRTGPKGGRRADPNAKRRSWSSSALACRTPRSVIDSSSVAKPWSITWEMCCRSSVYATVPRPRAMRCANKPASS
jgi:hypothetical protein